MQEDYVRNATLIRVIDGDTIDINIDLGFRIWQRQRVRILGINCPEMKGATRAAGLAAKAATEAWFAPVRKFVVRTHLDKTDSFGRSLAEVQDADTGDDLGAWLITGGHAVPYRTPVTPAKS